MGDSAGANIILCIVLNSLAETPDAKVPLALLAISPSTDLRRGHADIPRVAKHDPILRHDFIVSTANAWRGEWSPTDPRISPLYADVKILQERGVKVSGAASGQLDAGYRAPDFQP